MENYMILVLALCLLIAGCAPTTSVDKKCSYDTDGMLLVNGKRTFILGSYHLTKSTQPYQELAETGFNLVHTAATQDALDQAHAAGLHAWITVGTIDPANRETSSQKLRETVTQFKDHPALLIWESVDEPAWTWNEAGWRIPPEPFAEGYQIIKSMDPEHLMYMNHAPTNLATTLRKYNPGTDIVACDIYPVIVPGTKPMFALFGDGLQGDLLNTHISQVGEYTDKMRWVTEGKRPLFMVLQGFAWELLRGKETDSTLVKFPTRHETRFMAYNAIIHGATGINYWGHAYTPQPSPFWSDLKSVVSELASIQDILAERTKDMHIVNIYHEMGHSVDAGVEVMIKKARGHYYLFAANADKNPVKVSITGFGREKNAEVLFENRSLQIEDRKLTDTFKPFDVHIYKLSD